MALDKIVDSTQLDADLTSVANAIRTKSGGSNQLAFPAGFISEIQAIPSGGGQGLVDMTVNYTNTSSRSWAGTIENNAIKNFTTSSAYLPTPLLLKQPIAIKSGDIITMTLDNVSRPSNTFADFLAFSVCIDNSASSCKIQIAMNFQFLNGTNSKSLTYSGDPVIIWGFGVESRTNSLNLTYADVHIDINENRLF